MTERIDHAAAAREWVEASEKPTLGMHETAAVAAVAQVHATLALVEQQRIANLVALAEHAQRRYGNSAGEAGGIGTLLSYGDTVNGNMRLLPEIREALGL